MDFFEAQARARKRTSRLVVLFALAVISTIGAGYFAAILIFQQLSPRTRQFQSNFQNYQRTAGWRSDPAATHWWDPRLFAAVSLGTFAVVGLASLFKWRQFAAGGSAVAESVGGRAVNPHTTDLYERRLLNVVEEMAIASGIPVPAVYILDGEPAINAFAAGLNTSDAIVAVTRGTLEKLSRDEMQGVIGHEFSHILNGDMRLNLRIAAVVFGILVLGLAGRGVLWSLRNTRINVRGKGGGGVIVAIALIGVALLVIGYVGYFFGRLIQAAVSRQREFLADASSVQFTRNPAGLTGALKKIGGYNLGSSVQSNKSTAIGHFFFAQAFTAGLTGFWSTHPRLDERIRAIDPAFNGRMIDPPEVVDVAHESFVSAGLVPPRSGARSPASAGAMADRPAFASSPLSDGARRSPSTPEALSSPGKLDLRAATLSSIATAGTLTPQQLANARLLLDATPERLRAATQTPHEATALLFGLLLDNDPAVRARQRQLVAGRAGGEALRLLGELEPALGQLRAEHRLPLLQLALPALRTLPRTALEPFLDTLDELVHADEHISVFEFTLQKLLVRTLALGRVPGAAIVQIHSFNAVVNEVSIVLSSMARAATTDPGFAGQAFAAGAAELSLIGSQLRFREAAECDFPALDAALDRLATASPPIRQRTLLAAAQVVCADGQVLVSEFELLRAVAAVLDCPMPPLAAAA